MASPSPCGRTDVAGSSSAGSTTTPNGSPRRSSASPSDSGSLRRVGIDIPPGHQVGAADVVAVDRAIIRFASA